MSQRMRLDFYALAAKFAQEAGRPVCALDAAQCGDYPVIGVHSTVRGFEKEGSGLPHLVEHFGSNDESSRTLKELAYVTARGGTVGVFPRPTFIPPFSNARTRAASEFDIPQEVENDCDGSAKTFALKYLQMMETMKALPCFWCSRVGTLFYPQPPEAKAWERPRVLCMAARPPRGLGGLHQALP
jgi:hypothetical protein